MVNLILVYDVCRMRAYSDAGEPSCACGRNSEAGSF